MGTSLSPGAFFHLFNGYRIYPGRNSPAVLSTVTKIVLGRAHHLSHNPPRSIQYTRAWGLGSLPPGPPFLLLIFSSYSLDLSQSPQIKHLFLEKPFLTTLSKMAATHPSHTVTLHFCFDFMHNIHHHLIYIECVCVHVCEGFEHFAFALAQVSTTCCCVLGTYINFGWINE